MGLWPAARIRLILKANWNKTRRLRRRHRHPYHQRRAGLLHPTSQFRVKPPTNKKHSHECENTNDPPPVGVRRRDFLQYSARAPWDSAGRRRFAARRRTSAPAKPAPLPRPAGTIARPLPIGSTPFLEGDKLDFESLAAQVTFCNRGGVHGFVWPQIASGWTTLSEAERLAGTRHPRDRQGRGHHARRRRAVEDRRSQGGRALRQARRANGADASFPCRSRRLRRKGAVDYYQQSANDDLRCSCRRRKT